MKECSKCGEIKSLNRYSKGKQYKDGYFGVCKDCNRISPEKAKQKHLKKKYNISIQDYIDKYNSQEGKCDICNKFISIDIGVDKEIVACLDHNHTTLENRSLLCHKCNFLIGNCKESIIILENAIKYLKKYERTDL